MFSFGVMGAKGDGKGPLVVDMFHPLQRLTNGSSKVTSGCVNLVVCMPPRFDPFGVSVSLAVLSG